MIASAQRIARDCFYENRQIFADLCPNYQSLSTENKNSFIALVFASIAQVESSCNPSAQNPHGSNDIADGLFQLEYSRRQRAEAGRNERWCQTRNSVDTQSLTFQSQCAVSTIEDTVCRRDRRLNYRSGYWQKLQGDQRISRLIRNEANRWGLCN